MIAPPLSVSPAVSALMKTLHAHLYPQWQTLRQGTLGGSHASVMAVNEHYTVAPIPTDLRGRRAELIVEASDVQAVRDAMTSGADAVALDFDDTFSPTPANVQAAYDELRQVGNTAQRPPLLVRTRALYAVEPLLSFDGRPAIAALCDLAAALGAMPTRPPHFYIPKLETVAEAEFWEAALSHAEAHLGLPQHTVKVCQQIETFSGLLGADALLYALRQRAYGLNAGRWDYVFSLSKHLGQSRTAPLPPRSQLTMDVDAMRAYAEEMVRICRLRGAEAIGGTASFAPDPAQPEVALGAVLADKQREAAQGFTAAWAGLPALLDMVRQGFEGAPPAPTLSPSPDLYARLTDLPDPGPLPLDTVRDALSLSLAVLDAWYRGQGVVTRLGRIEDTATAELARAQLWQWVKVEAPLEGGERLTRPLYLTERRKLAPDDSPAARLLDLLVLSERCPDYFPRAAQEQLAPGGSL